MMRPYQYCTKEECVARQELRQVSELEATLETCRLPQSKRRLDLRLAVSKYRRSCSDAGGSSSDIRSRSVLTATLDHLSEICATNQATSNHPRIDDVDIVINFVADRVRACQQNAIRLTSGKIEKDYVPSSWHARIIRILIWLQYCYGSSCNQGNSADIERMFSHMRSTAYESYWSRRETEEEEDIIYCDDDEMLCYNAISSVCSISKLPRLATMTLGTSWNGMLLEFSKRRRRPSFSSSSYTSYPFWNLALEIVSYANRQQYFYVWINKRLIRELPILAKCCLSEVLLLWRYRTVQQYNVSFGKGESIVDMDRLLGIISSSENIGRWSIEYANVFGVPVVSSYNNNGNSNTQKGNEFTSTTISREPKITMTLKQVSIPEFDCSKIDANQAMIIRKCDQRWVFGEYLDDTTQMGIGSDNLRQLLEFGSFTNNDTCREDNSNNMPTPLKVPSAVNDSTQKSCIYRSSRTTSASASTSTRPSSLSNALGKIKTKRKNPCRFYAKGTCRNGDKCRFDHINYS